ncbi:hypothetical protein TELCIR_16411 [Teladorsagia circumcincta]|uniref:Mediator of RNA polymerase II transcription subunit 4 n=1 Tax=Teladorsagia circumcincta TaxID=45464 RepID=A0A2G9TVW2_TELCI|nr:hypothetical protein TELCIR_16411 [Teladorsagia circumcincta]
MYVQLQANNKIHSVRESEAHPVNSEVVIRLAHQISKNYSVSAPLYWQQEPEFRASALAAPRTNPPVVPPTFSLLRQQHVAPGGMGRVSSPMAGMPQIPMQGKVWSPRTGYQQASPSPRGRGGAQWAGRGGGPGGVSPFQKRTGHIGENSPRMVSPTVNINFVSPPPRMNPPPVNKVEQMSSDSSSSSSSDDESPK